MLYNTSLNNIHSQGGNSRKTGKYSTPADISSTDSMVRTITIYKITKIVRALWLAERSVCIRVCKHSCEVRCFAFRALITQARIWRRFKWSKLDKFTLFTHSVVGWNLENLYKQAVSTFFCLSWHFKRQKSVFWNWKHLFAKQELITRARLRVQDFATGKNFSFNHFHNKEFCVFSQESYFIKAIENFFPVFS